MGIVQMGYYRARCDQQGCPIQINVASETDRWSIIDTLRSHKWWVDPYADETGPALVKCPAHDPEKK
jgi:hypothetical protein